MGQFERGALCDYTWCMTFDQLDFSLSPLERLRRQAARREDYLDLSSSNPTLHGFIFPPDILRKAADEYWRTRRYQPDPKGSLRAREAIAQYYARRDPPLPISPEHIFITASTSEAYSLSFALLTAPSDNVLAPVPGYPLFDQLATLHHISLIPYTLDPPSFDASQSHTSERLQWHLDGTHMLAQINERTRAILMISPHNPTGHVLTPNFQLPTSNFQLPVIADEVFCEFPFAARSVPPLGALFPEATVFHLNGVSKMFALPDLKLGWIALSGPRTDQYVDQLELLNDTFLSANSLTQFMLPALFEHGMLFVQSMRQQIQSNLRAALDALQTIPSVRVAAPLGGHYLFPEILHCADEDVLLERMLAVGLFAHPGYFYDEERGCHLMLSGLIAQPHMLKGIAQLKNIILEK
jgi:alanine-synthesizing transaminase